MNDDLISRSELKKVIETYRPILITSDYLQGKNNMIDYCIAEIEGAPTVDERPHGEWVEKEETPASVSYYCSNCGCVGLGVEHFCAWCGADMRGSAE